MAKKSKQEKAADAATSRTEQLRAAVEGAFGATAQGTAPVQKRAQELVDEFVGAATRLGAALVENEDVVATATRVRGAVEGLRPPSSDQVDALRAEIAKLEARVGQLEAAAAKPARPATRPAPARKPAGGAAKPAAAPRRTAARKPST